MSEVEKKVVRQWFESLADGTVDETVLPQFNGWTDLTEEALMHFNASLQDSPDRVLAGHTALKAIYRHEDKEKRGRFQVLLSNREDELKKKPKPASRSEPNPPAFQLLTDEEADNVPDPEWLIPQLILKNTVNMVYGPPKCLKTFVVLGVCFAVATGRDWYARKVAHGKGVYIAAEGSVGLKRRRQAWKAYHEHKGETGIRWINAPVFIANPEIRQALIDAIDQVFVQEVPTFIVIDTLSRCAIGLNESDNSEMARFIEAADELRRKYQCTVIIVHHDGKSGDSGPRGAQALTGNVDNIIQVVRTDAGCKLHSAGAKDIEAFQDVYLKTHQVVYGPGELDNSLVLLHGEKSEERKPTAVAAALTVLRNHGPMTSTAWKEACMRDAGLKEDTFKKLPASLREKGLVRVPEGSKLYHIVEPTDLDNED